MKKPFILIAVALVALFSAPVAEARGYHSRSYVKYHHSCSGPAWVETYVAYHDRFGRPVFRTRVVPVHRHVHRRPAYHPVHRPVPACPPPGISFSVRVR